MSLTLAQTMFIGRPATNDAVNRAVQMVANGTKPRAAWEECGQPNGESAIINIRARGRALKLKRTREEEQSAETSPVVQPEAAPSKQRKIYLNARQTEQQHRRKREIGTARKEIYKEASLQVASARSDGTFGQLGSRYTDFAAAAAATDNGGARGTSVGRASRGPALGESAQQPGSGSSYGRQPRRRGTRRHVRSRHGGAHGASERSHEWGHLCLRIGLGCRTVQDVSGARLQPFRVTVHAAPLIYELTIA